MRKILSDEIFQRMQELKIESHHFLLAISGGPDSMAMLNIFDELQKKYSVKFSVCHLNHQLREESREEETELEIQFKKKSYNYIIDKVDVRSWKKKRKISIEMAAHELRYKFFDYALDKLNADILCTGHHQNDQVETILMNLFRGCGHDGIKGLNEWDGKYFKPLLNFNKKAIHQFLADNNIKYFTDKSNFDNDMERNFWRNEILNKVESYYGKSYSKKFLQSINNLKWNNYDQKLLEEKVNEVYLKQAEHDYLYLDIVDLKKYLSHFLKQFIDRLISNEINSTVKLNSREFQELVSLIHSGESAKYIEILNQVCIEKSFDKLIIYKKENKAVEVEVYPERIVSINEKYNFRITQSEKPENTSAHFSEEIEGDNVSFPLIIRQPKGNEKFKALGMEGKQKVNRFLKGKKVYSPERKNVFALYNKDEIVWMIGHRISENYKVKDTSQIKYHMEIIEKKDGKNINE